MYVYIKQHENNNKNQSKIMREKEREKKRERGGGRERERERGEREREIERMLLCAASNYFIEFVIPWQNDRTGPLAISVHPATGLQTLLSILSRVRGGQVPS